MVRFSTSQASSLLALGLASTASAWAPPGYGGYALIWTDNFVGSGGSLPDGGNWNIITGDLGVNNELQIYTSNSNNVQRSGGDTLQLVPQRDGGAPRGWTSGRIESRYVFTPQPGEITRAEAVLRFGDNGAGNKQGIWPAFWMLGDSIRHGTPWPACGEIDIMEHTNGNLGNFLGTLHCDVYPGGICNEGNGIGSRVSLPDYSWHTWRVEIDLRSGNWADQALRWTVDGQQFHEVTGGRLGNQGVWNAVAHSPLYFILNVAVGGSLPGNPNDATIGGWGSMMEVGYVAHYTT
jgi:beta-glucanase (GH16 family)